jgi:ribonuclease-3
MKFRQFAFNNPELLDRALTHRSALNEPESGTPVKRSYERLEFLGDAVLELIITHYLFDHYPQEPEGKLTTYRSALVRTTTLAEVARDLGLGAQLYMSRGEVATGGRDNPSLLADVVEAVIGAIYLDQGLEAAKKFIDKFLLPKFSSIKEQHLYQDPKSHLQEVVQTKGFPAPEYQIISAVGPDHDKRFTAQVTVRYLQQFEQKRSDQKQSDQTVNKPARGKAGKTQAVKATTITAKGRGRSKQRAQEAAARKILKKIIK